MLALSTIRATLRHPSFLATATTLVLGSAACTLLLDHNSTQCQSDADCAHFGGLPVCQRGLCVKSGLGPPDCFSGMPRQPQDFANQCSSAECLSFDNCQRLQLCGSPTPDTQPLRAPAKRDAGGVSGPLGVDAGAMPSCVDPARGRTQVVYMTGSSEFAPLLAKLAPIVIAGGGPTPVFLISDSCTGVKSGMSSVDADHFIHDPAAGSLAAKYAAYFGADGIPVPCILGSAGARVDIGESGIFASTCAVFPMTGNGATESVGPNQAMAFIVPGASGQTAISEEAAREAFGSGGNGGVPAPWINPARYYIPGPDTSTQQMIAHAISVPADQFWGMDQGNAADIDQALKALTGSQADEAIGIISVDWYDNDRKNLKALAYKASQQDCAYLPDSTSDAMDKRNVRDGHYPIWGPIHFFTGDPVPAAAGVFLAIVAVPKADVAVLDAFIAASLVPTCAMTVQRDAEIGSLRPYSPPFQCG
ncbi:MAG: hypothetical protein M3O46_17115, partial [Myxococcota bacterium]|nr:hypothetical protein [Myxococcota bacterium]